MKWSVAMATYNGAAYLPEQMLSIAGQTCPPDELVIRDDGSTDETPTIVQNLASRVALPVRMEIGRENLGYARNFEAALSRCSGEFVSLADQDDVWLPKKLETVASFFESSPDVFLVLNDHALVDGEMQPTGRSVLGNIRAAGLPDAHFVAGCCMTLRRELLDLVLPFPAGVRAHDSWISKVASWMNVRKTLPHQLQLYRRHASATSTFYGTALKRPSRFQEHLRYLGNDPRPAWTQELSLLEEFATRLCGLAENHPLKPMSPAAMRRIDERRNILETRLDLLSHTRLERILLAPRSLDSQPYRNGVRGLLSLGRDLIR